MSFSSNRTKPNNVNLTDVQTLENKTFDDEIIVKELAADPSTPASGYKAIYSKTDGKVYTIDDAGNVAQVGADSAIYNYIDNGKAEVDTTGWTVYANTSAGTSPDDFGGTPNGSFTWTRSTSTPLVGAASFLLTKDAANRQGHGVYYEFTAENGHLTKKLLLSMLADTSALDDGDLRIYLVSSSDSFSADFNVISPANPEVLAGTPDIFKQLQLDASDTEYRLCLHYASTDTDAKTAKFDDFSFGPRAVATSAFIGDWEEVSLSGSWTTNTTYVSKKRRVGDVAEYQVTLEFSGAPNATTFELDLDEAIDTGKLTNLQGQNHLGTATLRDQSASDPNDIFIGVVTYQDSDSVRVRFGQSASTYLGGSVFNETTPITIASSDRVNLHFSVPIAGWSSNAKSSEDLGSREIVALYGGNSTQSVGSGASVIMDFPTQSIDSTASVTTGASWRFTAPETGTYEINGSVSVSITSSFNGTTERLFIAAYKNGSSYRPFSGPSENIVMDVPQSASVDKYYPFSFKIQLDKGDYFDLRGTQSSGSAHDFTPRLIHIQKLASPQTILETETVAASYTFTGGAVADGAKIPFDTLDGDTHNTMNTSTGDYTVPTSGWYTATMTARPTSAVACAFDIYRDSTQMVRAFNGAADDSAVGCSRTFYCNKGQIISVRNNTGVSRTLSGGFETTFSIARIK